MYYICVGEEKSMKKITVRANTAFGMVDWDTTKAQ